MPTLSEKLDGCVILHDRPCRELSSEGQRGRHRWTVEVPKRRKLPHV